MKLYEGSWQRMAISDTLPDRPLTFDEFQKLQSQDGFDALYTADTMGDIDILIAVRDGMEYTLHYTDEEGWHVSKTEEKE